MPIYRSYGFLTDIPLVDITTGEAVHDYSNNNYLGHSSLMVFWNCNCGDCKDCGLDKQLFKKSYSPQTIRPKFIAPVWLDELCEDKFDSCIRSPEEAVILSVYFQYLPAFVAKMPFVEMPHAVLLNKWGRVQDLNFHPDALNR